MIRNIVFDVGSVLVRVRPEEAMTDLGFDKAKAEETVRATLGNPIWRELDRGVMKKEDVLAAIKEGHPSSVQDGIDFFFEKAVWNFVKPFPYSRIWLSSLRERGYKVFLLSNYPAWLWSVNEQNAFDFLDCIDGKVVSGFEQVIKPDPAIYQLLLSRYSLSAPECVFLDDVEENVAGARREGFSGIVFRSYEQASAELEELLKA
ncbi:MAG: HAD family phosphatase [Treponema sp.]|nr:HAD family phosphatase [Treponema sp.]MBQ6566455.1 HAD family phosphatase [Treponema sp.]